MQYTIRNIMYPIVHKGHIVKYPVMYFMVPSKKK